MRKFNFEKYAIFPNNRRSLLIILILNRYDGFLKKSVEFIIQYM